VKWFSIVLLWAGAALTAAAPAGAETYRVGPGRALKRLAPVVPKLKAGDVVEIDPGVYREVFQFRADGTKKAAIVIRGAGRERPVFDAKGLNVSGRGKIPRGIFEIRGACYVIEHIAFRNARNGNNGAGIRLRNSSNAVIRDCTVTRCDMGIMGGDRETATVEACEIAFNGTPKFDGYSHNFYMHGNRFVLRGCHVHDSLNGQNVKTRAHYNELWYNWIADSNEGEVGPVDGRGETNRPNSNVLMVGNVVVSKPDRTGNAAKFVLFGSELGGSHDGTLYLYNNTFVAGSPRIIFVQLHDAKARAVIRNNIFFGSDQVLHNARKPISVAGSHNWMPATAAAPAGFTNTVTGAAPGFLDRAKRDFRLKRSSACVNRGLARCTYRDGDGRERPLVLDRHYRPHLALIPRKQAGPPDLGAYELGASFTE